MNLGQLVNFEVCGEIHSIAKSPKGEEEYDVLIYDSYGKPCYFTIAKDEIKKLSYNKDKQIIYKHVQNY